MRKCFIIIGICVITLALALLFYFHFSHKTIFSCESRYDVTQHINNDILHSQGVLTAEFSTSDLLINFEGLVTRNDEKYILSRSIDLTLKKYTNSNNLFYISEMAITRYGHDNTPENTAQQTLFSHQNNDRVIYIDRVNDDTILFGNQIIAQYGCERK